MSEDQERDTVMNVEPETKRKIDVWYNCQSDMSHNWLSGAIRLSDWYEFADWLKQLNEAGKAVLITQWNYV